MCKSSWTRPEKILFGILFACTVAVVFARAFFGVETTDEALYASDALLVTQGAVPYVTLLFQGSGASLLPAALIALYKLFVGGTQGIILFLRVGYLLVKLASLFAVYWLLRKQIQPFFLALALLAMFPYSLSNVIGFSYNTVPLLFFLPACALSCQALPQEVVPSKRALFMSASAGCLMALATYSHLAMVFTAVFMVGLYLVCALRHRRRFKLLLCFCGGGLATALAMFVYMVFATGGLSSVAEGLRLTLSSGFFSLDSNSFIDKLRSYGLWLPYLQRFIYCFLPCLAAVAALVYAARKKVLAFTTKQGWLLALSFASLVFLLVCAVRFVLGLEPGLQSVWTMCAPVLAALPFLVFPCIKENRAQAKSLLWTFHLPMCFFGIANALPSVGLPYGRIMLLTPAACLSAVFIGYAFCDTFPQLRLLFRRSIPAALYAAVVLGASLSSLCSFVYRDEPIQFLRHRVETGMYAGLYTTSERADDLQTLETTIRSVTTDGERVMFMDAVPFGYLMTNARACAPSSWDLMFYDYKQNDPTLPLGYFDLTGHTPDKIIYIRTGQYSDTVSIEAPGYLFNEYVHKYYDKIQSIENISKQIYVYQRREGT